MSMRISSLSVLALALAACKPAPDAAADAKATEPREEVKQEDLGPRQVACALDGSEVFADICEVEQSRQDGTHYLVVRHPDGGFRRFEVLTDGHGLATADGSEIAETMLDNGKLEVAVGLDYYLFPATIKDNASGP